MSVKSNTSVRPIVLVLLTLAATTMLVTTFWYNNILVYPLQWRSVFALAVSTSVPSVIFMTFGYILFKP